MLPAGLVQTHHIWRADQGGRWAWLPITVPLLTLQSSPCFCPLPLSPCMSGPLLFISLSLAVYQHLPGSP